MNARKGHAWPLSIIIIFIFLSLMLFGILYISLRSPIHTENMFQMGYQEVDKGFNDIHAAQLAFDADYDVMIMTPKLSVAPVETMRANGEKVYFDHSFTLNGENQFSVQVKDKAGNAIDKADISLLLTRFETSEYDKEIKVLPIKNGDYKSEPFTIAQEGRWKIVAKVAIGDKTGFFERDVYAR